MRTGVPTSRRGSARPVAVVLVAATIIAAACDDDGASQGTAASPSTAGTSAPTATATTVVATAAASAAPPGEPTFTFGYLAPGVGLLNALAIGQQRGLTLAIEEINANGGVLGGPVAAVTTEESADRPIEAVLDELLEHEPDVIVGPVGSATAVSVIPVLAERSLVACSASATATSLTSTVDEGDDPPPFVRTALRDDHLARIVADELMTAADEGDPPPPATVMVVGRDDVYGNELTAALSAELTARGAEVSTLTYPPRRVDFLDEAATVVDAGPDLVVAAAFAEAPNLVARLVDAGYDVDRIVGLDGLLVPRLAEQTFPADPGRADGLTVIGTTGDRALLVRLTAVPASEDQVSYGPQMYDCAITLALAAMAARSTEPATIAQQLPDITAGGRTCSTFAHCVELLDAGEDIDYDGTTGHIAFDERGDISTARVVTARVVDGQLQPERSREVDLIAEGQEELFASAVFVAQLQQALKLLGYYDGDVTGVFDEATAAAVSALQRDLGLPVTGEYDEATDAALRARLGGRVDALRTSIAELQQELTDLGFYSGPIDGRYSDATIAAVRAFQRDLGVPETGIIDVATLRAIYARGRAAAAPAQTTTTAPPSPTTTSRPATTAPPARPPATTTTAPPPPTEPPPPATTAAPPTTVEPPAEERSLYEVLAEDPDFSTLVEIARVAGYGTDFAQPVPLTVFAPTNEAFASLDDDELDELRSDPTAADAMLRELAVEGAITADELSAGELQTIGGSFVDVEVDGSTITFGGAPVGRPDISASNGIAHGIEELPA